MRALLAAMWLARLLPARALAALGNALGALAFRLIAERRNVTRINLAKCFPWMPAAERERLARAHFRAWSRTRRSMCPRGDHHSSASTSNA